MYQYLPHSKEDKEEMLKEIGLKNISGLFKDIPKEIREKCKIKEINRHSETEIKKIFSELSKKNINMDEYISFVGGGYYDHFIPEIIDHIVSRSEFLTSYTPYQAEISQGYLQAIFEYQSSICELMGMEVSNASVYDTGTGAAEAAFMAVNIKKKRNKILVSKTVAPNTREVIKTYLKAAEIEYIEVEMVDLKIDMDDLDKKIDDNTAGVIVEYPNYFGEIEDLETIDKEILEDDTLLISIVDPISMGILRSPGSLGVDIAIGEGQSLGNKLSYGSAFGFLTTKNKYMRYVPGRIVGQTKDTKGNPAYVLTLQAREQHIRREKASSNICSNQALNALRALVYMSIMGKKGIYEVGERCFQGVKYLSGEIEKIQGYKILSRGIFVKEFVVKTEKGVDKVMKTLLKNNIIGGLALEKDYIELKDSFLVAVTEKRTKEELDKFVEILEGIK